ncbi:S66 peptidase family protein [Sporosarcina sp. NCCP-2222]|uniref:S66 family peptidase n=1 Tax=Sporosarcina sp. NCCP-2222 TaxID=2935073 RepID=UPI0020BFCEE2|nr:S66 peptidase family protein [Sporosarcina sp. NCCP-2222]
MQIPGKLKSGDEIRIIAPSRSACILSEEGIQMAKERLQQLGFTVSFGRHVFEKDLQNSTSIEQRVEDLHDAFSDKQVKGILSVIGGFNSNELLPYIDYELIKKNPKIFCGFSDITATANAITAKTGMVTYSGPHFSSFQMVKGQEYQTHFFTQCLMQDTPFELKPSSQWSDDAWYLDQENRNFEETSWKTYQAGTAAGTLWGGNLCTLNLLQGTDYMPNLENAVLFVEDDEMTIPETFARDLTSLLQTVKSLKALVIGRFQRTSNISEEQLLFILDKHPILKGIPVLYDVDFGHTQPMFTFPIGGEVLVDASAEELKLVRF